MIKNDAGVLLSSFTLQIRVNKKELFFFPIPLLQMLRFSRRVNIMILFIDEYVTVFRREQKKRYMRSVSSKHPVS